ncbi:MAG: SusC/RagA family TonB-linked outer membrane protein [Cyclobacteriaceae bacterium]|nr:SusC/RagA family TonB-linked outer membrane protein [Cyclobacteriaceae bacterium]
MNGAYSQLVRVTGRVTDFKNLPLFQVAIKEQGKFQATFTDSEGNYQVNVHKGAMLVFSKAGYTSIEMQAEEVLNISMNEDLLLNRNVADVGYYSLHRNKFSDAVGYLGENNFNQGNVYDPAMLLQGRIPGLNISNRGGDPNVESTIRIRGLSSFDSKAQPLIVIDGVPMASFINLDPQDVASVTILKDGASASIYGIRGSGGVILITTKKATMKSGLSVSLSAQGSVASLSKEQPVLTSSQHIQVGGSDLGSSTNWQREITQMGANQEYHLAVSGATDKSSFRVSTHLRSVNGILLHSGFDQSNTRINITHQALDNRLRFNFNASFSNRNINYSFPEAFKYAIRFNPSAPIRFSTGEFYQAILFDSYNPMALLELNTDEGKKQATTLNGKIDWDIFKNLTASLQVAHQQTTNYRGQFFSKKSFYKGMINNGLAEKYQDEASFTYAESYLTYNHDRENVKFNIVGGYAYQEDRVRSFGASVTNFETDATGYKVLGYSYDELFAQPGLTRIFRRNSADNRTIAGFIRTHWQIGSGVNLFSTLRQEGSSKLGENAKAGMFGSLGMNIDLLAYFKQTNFSFFNFRLNYGTTGSIPTGSGWAQDYYQYSVVTNDSTKIHSGNPNLRWELKKEINTGFDLGWYNLSFSIDAYTRKVSDLIQLRYVAQTDKIQYLNAADLSGRGLEFSLGYKVGQKNGLLWYPMLMLSTNRVIVEKYPEKQELRGQGERCGCGTLLIRTAVGEKIGQMWSPVYAGVNASGYPIMKDVNGNGTLEVNSGAAFAANTDFTDVGNAFPVWELGWNNRFVFKNFQLSAFFRGAFGHSLINSARMAHEPEDQGALSTFNWIRTNKAVSGLTNSVYSSLYVERADFLMLDNLILEYTLPLKLGRDQSFIKVYGAAQRLFTITKYTGVDPEPSLFNRDFWEGDVLAPGIDRMGNYFPARTFTIGLSFKL